MNGETQIAFGIGIIDVVIGLAFIFFSLSVIASYLLESYYGVTRGRARFLQTAVAQLVDERVDGKVSVGELTSEIFAHPLIAKKSRRVKTAARFSIAATGPAYISSTDFSDVLLAILGERYPHQPSMAGYAGMLQRMPPDQSIKAVLVPLLEKSSSISEFRQQIASWYEDSMERASGTFKRGTQLPLLVIGTALALSMDMSTIDYANRLATDGALRHALVAEAKRQVDSIDDDVPELSKEYLADVSSSIKLYKKNLDNFDPHTAAKKFVSDVAEPLASLSAPTIGQSLPALSKEHLAKLVAAIKSYNDNLTKLSEKEAALTFIKEGAEPLATLSASVAEYNREARPWSKEGNTFLWILGCILTGVAVSLGTSFWLSFLRLMISVRSSIRPVTSGASELASKTGVAGPTVVTPIAGTANDVFEDNLDAKKIADIQELLGLKAHEVTGEMSAATRTAIDNWRQELGLPLSGSLSLDEYVLLTNPSRWKR